MGASLSLKSLVERRPTVLLSRSASVVEPWSPSRRLVAGRATVATHVWKKARTSSQRLVERRPTVLLSRFASDVAVMTLIGVIKSMIGASGVESWLPSRKLVAGRAMVAMHVWKRASLSLKSLAERRPTVLLGRSAGDVEKMTMTMMLSLKVSSKSRRAMIVASVVEPWLPSRRLVAGRATVATHVLKKAKTSSQRLVERRPTVLLRRFASGGMLMTLMMKAMIVASAVESSSPSRRLVVGRAMVALHVWKKARASSQRLVERRPTVLLSRFASDEARMVMLLMRLSFEKSSLISSSW